MAWIKVTSFSSGVRYCINTAKLITFGQPTDGKCTNLPEPGDIDNDKTPRRVKETPDELLALIRLAELDNRGVETFTYAHPPEELK